MQTTTRSLLIMRHAKAEAWADTDHVRRLTGRGEADAAATGRWLAETGRRPDHVLVSSSARTIDTWEAVSAAGSLRLEPEVEPGLYDASPDAVLDLVRETAEHVGTLLVIGHNPTMAWLAQMLDGGDGDPDATAALQRGFPTAAVAAFAVPGGWRDLALGEARLVAVHP